MNRKKNQQKKSIFKWKKGYHDYKACQWPSTSNGYPHITHNRIHKVSSNKHNIKKAWYLFNINVLLKYIIKISFCWCTGV